MIEKKKMAKKIPLNLIALLRIKIGLGTRIIKRGGLVCFSGDNSNSNTNDNY